MAVGEDAFSSLAGAFACLLMVSVVFSICWYAHGQRSPAKGKFSTKQGDGLPAKHRAEVQVEPPRTRSRTTPLESSSSKASTACGLPFCCLGWEMEEQQSSDRPKSAAVQAGRSVMHPKWCGLRLQEPSEQLPSFEVFSPEPPDDALLNKWAALSCTEDERQRCQQLATLVRDVDGPKDAITLLRFLRARKKLDDAAKMYSKVMAWRAASQKYKGLVDGTADTSLHRRFDSWWQPNGVLGRDREGDGIFWEFLGRVNVSQCHLLPVTFFLDHQMHTLVRAQQALDEQTKLHRRPHMYYTIVVDLHGLGVGHLNFSGFRKYQKCIRFAQDYFPEMIKRVIVCGAPWIFGRIWSIVQVFFDEGLREKMIFLRGDETIAGLRKHIDEKWIPANLGGALRVAGNVDCSPILPPPAGLVPQELMDDIVAAYGPPE